MIPSVLIGHLSSHPQLLLDRFKENQDGGILPGFAGVDIVRAAAYQHTHLQPTKPHCNGRYRMTIMKRTNTRQWEEYERLNRLLNKRFSHVGWMKKESENRPLPYL